jgi:hypothetical protein
VAKVAVAHGINANVVRSSRRMSSNSSRKPVYPSVYPWDCLKTKRVSSIEANPLILLAEWTGLEPATPGVTGRGSNKHPCRFAPD